MSETIGGWGVDLVPGEVKAIRNEEHLCVTCYQAPVCKVATAIEDDFLIVISRCAMYLNATPVEADDEDEGD